MAIAISSLLGKLFDTILIKLQHASLFTDLLQFGFKPNSSTVYARPFYKTLLNIIMKMAVTVIYYF